MKKHLIILFVLMTGLIALSVCAEPGASATQTNTSSFVDLVKRGESDCFQVSFDLYATDTRELPIGVFDSGIGGLTVLSALLELDDFNNVTHEPGPDGRPDFEDERFIYLGDQANMPYGNYPSEQRTDFLRELILKDATFLLGDRYWLSGSVQTPRHNKPPVKAIVIACNTATAYGLETVNAALKEWRLPVQVIGIVDVGASGAVQAISERGGKGTVAVLATVGTCQSEGYVRAIAKRAGETGITPPAVIQQGCLGLAGAIEGDPSYINTAQANQTVDYRGPSVSNPTAPIDPGLTSQYNFEAEGLLGNVDQPATWQLNSVENYIRYHTASLMESYRRSGNSVPISAVILGCTHFPFHANEISESFRRLRDFHEPDGDAPYKNLLLESPSFIDPAALTAKRLYETLAESKLLIEESDEPAINVDEFYISVPNASQPGVKLAETGGFTYDYKYGRDPGYFEREYVKRVPMSKENLSHTVRKTIQATMPAVWDRLVIFDRESPRTQDLPNTARIASSMKLGGCGGVYFYAPPGELWVEVEKQDLNIRSVKTHLRALLFGPDRSVVDEAWISDDGRAAGSGPGSVQRALLRTNVVRPGVYGLNITVTEDRYGENVSWGFRSNCRKYLVETSRGHRDARHEEPIVLRNAGHEGDVGFMPRTGSFSIDVSGLIRGSKDLTVYDADGNKIVTIPVSPLGTAQHGFPADKSREGKLWRLLLDNAQAVIQIDDVTHWERGEMWENLSLWTPDLSSWFPFHENRWLLIPYSRNVYAGDASEGTISFSVHNNSPARKRVKLSLEFDDDAVWSAELPQTDVELRPNRSAEIPLRYKVPSKGTQWKCYVRASVADETGFSTWSSVTLHRGIAPAESPLKMPIELEPYRHENEQFGYLPDYPLDNQVYFDMKNRPFIVADDGVFTLRNNTWVKTTTAQRGVTGRTISIRPVDTKIAFDRDNDVYLLGRDGGSTVLLHSNDHGATFTGWPVPGSGGFDIEQFSGHNELSGPPPLARFHETAHDPKLMWRRINDLDLILPAKKPDGSIVMGNPIAVSKQCIGLSAHSGIPSTIVSRGDKVHITWGEATDPQAKAPGVPTYVATYNRTAGKLESPALVGYGPPANDVHNSPCITIDGEGYLHVLIGTHGRTFKYVRSLLPNSANGGWTPAEDVGPGLRQTYVGMVCGPDNTLHLVFRLWLNDNKYYPAGYYANLAYMSKRPGEKWSDARPLVVAPFSEYSIFYHRLTIDRKGTLFLSYDYWSTFWFYRTDHPGTRRSLMMSPDGGATWKLASSIDFEKD